MIVGVDARELQGRPTGTGRYLRSLIRHWTEASAAADDRFVAYFNGPVPADPILARPSIACRSLAERPAHGLYFQERLLPRAVARDDAQVFFAPAYTCPLRLGIPRVTAVHDLSFFSVPQDFAWREGSRRRLLTAASVRVSRRVLACSSFSAREIVHRFPDAADRVRVVPLGPDEDLPPPPPRDDARRRLGTRGPSILTVGTILGRRQLPVLLRATSLLARRFEGLTLDVVGENRTHPFLDVAALAREAGLADRVRLSGFVSEPDLADRYAAADVAVFLSEYEGFGLPALEAAARGVPLVTSRLPSLGEVFAGAALLVDSRDAGAVASAVERVLTDLALRRDLVARGRALAARHSWAETARLTRLVLAEAAEG